MSKESKLDRITLIKKGGKILKDLFTLRFGFDNSIIILNLKKKGDYYAN